MIQSLVLPTLDAPVKHPAKFSPDLLRVMQTYLRRGWMVYDPFGGVGGLHRIASATGAKTVCGEIEPRVIANARGTRSLAANAMYLPFADETFDAIATSPTYGNRMADKNFGQPSTSKWDSHTYSVYFGGNLHPANTGGMQWGAEYKRIHEQAWSESIRVLKPGGLFILNISDHIRAGQRVYVSKWHFDVLRGMGLRLMDTRLIKTPRLTRGANSQVRTAGEYIFVMVKQ